MVTEHNTPVQAGLQGRTFQPTTPDQAAQAIELAFDYRGDVTLLLKDGRTLEGYLFDRRKDQPVPVVRMIQSEDSAKVTIRYADIVSLVFSGRDTAAGKSWETWVRKYKEKKTRGEAANIEAEPLE